MLCRARPPNKGAVLFLVRLWAGQSHRGLRYLTVAGLTSWRPVIAMHGSQIAVHSSSRHAPVAADRLPD